MTLSAAWGEPLRLVYLLAFGTAAALCLVSTYRIRRIDHPDTRIGLAALLLISAVWALTHVGYLGASSGRLQHGFYLFGLVIGLSAVGAWLYFCSAYTGRSLHRDGRIRRVAVGSYLGLVSIKLTNDYHGLYYATEAVSVPFAYLAVVHRPLHWIVMGLAYAAATVGFFMLFERFYKADHAVGPLAGLAAITALPVVLDIVGFLNPVVLQIPYSPLGVAVFAAGVMFVYIDQFRTLQIAGTNDTPVVILDESDAIREANGSARTLFPELDGDDVIGRQLRTALPDVAETAVEDRPVIDLEVDGGTRHYLISSTPFTAGETEIGRTLSFTDVTESERYRLELEWQNERLDTFASMLSHDLRNPLAVAEGHLELARAETDTEDLETVDEALDRMNALIEDVLQLARQGRPISDTEPVDVDAVVRDCWRMVESNGSQLVVVDPPEIDADPDRLRQLLENLLRNAIEHGATGNRLKSDDSVEHGSTGSLPEAESETGHDARGVTVRIGALDRGGFYVEDDGPGIPESDRENVFGSGFTTNDDGTGFGLAIVKEIVDAHGWRISVTEGSEGGARFEIET